MSRQVYVTVQRMRNHKGPQICSPSIWMMHTVAERRSNQVEDLGWTGEFVYQVGSDRKTSHIDIRYTRVRSGLQQEFVIPNFFIHFWYSDVTVKRNETTQSSHLDLGDLTQTTDGGAGGSGSGGAVKK